MSTNRRRYPAASAMTDNMMGNVALKKQMLRRQLHDAGVAVTTHQKRVWNIKISSTIVTFGLYQQAHTIACFIPLADEPDIWPVIRDAWKQKKTVAVPLIEGTELILKKIICKNDLEIGPYHIRQPKDTCPLILLSSIDTFFVPGQAFDRNGNRLGRGQGYYDRLLKNIHKPTIGVCYGFQLFNELPHDCHDIKVDSIITEKGYIDTMI
jgi:5-formyltetrahydrofolate cyclo-ligase